MEGRVCYHCKQWIEPGEAHDCWTTTEAALTRDLSEELRDAWERLRETVVEFGEQRIYASHHSIMFARKVCYFFVRPKKKVLEICFFLGRTLKSPQVKTTMAASQAKVAHIVHVQHRDQVEAPITDWLREAYDVSPTLSAKRAVQAGAAKTVKAAKTTKRARTAKVATTAKRAAKSARKSAPSVRKTKQR